MINGSIRMVTVASPAAGANWTYTHPAANLISRLLCFHMRITIGAGAAVRYLYVGLFNAAGISMSFIPWRYAVGLTAGADPRHLIAYDDYNVDEATYSPIPPGLEIHIYRPSSRFFLLPGWTILSMIQNIQVGDQLSEIRLELEDLNLVRPGAIG
jgi:hypothetical protein